MVIEPCCFSKQITALLQRMGKEDGYTVGMYNTGEWTLGQALPWLVNGNGEETIILARPTLSESTIAALANLMGQTVVREGKNVNAIRGLEIVTFVDERTMELLRQYLGSYTDRLSVAHCTHHTHFLYCDHGRGEYPLLVLGEVPEKKQIAPCCNIVSKDSLVCMDVVAPIRSLIKVNRLRNKLIEIVP